jgi:hypothetical protein
MSSSAKKSSHSSDDGDDDDVETVKVTVVRTSDAKRKEVRRNEFLLCLRR